MTYDLLGSARSGRRFVHPAVILLALAVILPARNVPSAGDTKSPDAREPYRFQLKADGGGKVAFRGLITVDGADRVIERDRTPFEFRCEAGSIIAGYFESLEPDRGLSLKVFDPSVSKRHPTLTYKGPEKIRFSWAKPGVGPRCADQGDGACPTTTPSIEALRARLDELVQSK